MVNDRGKSTAVDLAWSPDGSKIIIAYADAAVICGSVDGRRLWGKDLGLECLRQCAWGPDGKTLLFATERSLHVYDDAGNAVRAVDVACLQGRAASKVTALAWHPGGPRSEAGGRRLCIATDAGGLQLGRGPRDPAPLVLDAGLRLRLVRWHPDGGVVAVAGIGSVRGGRAGPGAPPGAGGGGGDEGVVVRFYTSRGRHVQSLRVPGGQVNGLAWEPSGRRLAVAVDGHVFFAAWHPCRPCGWLGPRAVAVATVQPASSDDADGTPHAAFWDATTGALEMRPVPGLTALAACAGRAVLVAEPAEGAGGGGAGVPDGSGDQPVGTGGSGPPREHSIVTLVDTAGTPISEHRPAIRIRHVAMGETHFVGASDDAVYCLKLPTGPEVSPGGGTSGARGTGGRRAEWIWSADATTTSDHWQVGTFEGPRAGDPITCVALSLPPPPAQLGAGGDEGPGGAGSAVTSTASRAPPAALLVGRRSGQVRWYQLADLRPVATLAIAAHPCRLALSCDGARLAAVCGDARTLSLHLVRGRPGGHGSDVLQLEPSKVPERRDCWDARWASDDPAALVVMEKCRLTTLWTDQNSGEGEAEPPVPGWGALGPFEGLAIATVDAEAVAEVAPGDPPPAAEGEASPIGRVRTQSLVQVEALLQRGSSDELQAYLGGRVPPRVWRVVAEYALLGDDLDLADRALAQCGDWHGLELVKRLRGHDEAWRRRAETLAFLGRWDEAEAVYTSREANRPDLALELRARLGDWFRAAKFLEDGSVGDDAIRAEAQLGLGRYYADRGAWRLAVGHFVAAREPRRALECFARLRDHRGMNTLLDALPEGDPALLELGERLAAVGMGAEAVTALLKGGDPRAAVDACLRLNEWDLAVELGAEHGFGQISGALARAANALRTGKQPLRAVELYQRALEHGEAAALLRETATDAVRRGGCPPLRAKQLLLLAALEGDAHRDKAMREAAAAAGGGGGGNGTAAGSRASRVATRAGQTLRSATRSGDDAAARTLAGLVKADRDDALAGGESGAWEPCLGWHHWLAANRQLYQGDFAAALPHMIQTARHAGPAPCVSERDALSALALTAAYAGYRGTCSRALTRLGLLPSLGEAEADAVRRLGFTLFVGSSAIDGAGAPEDPEPSSGRGGGGVIHDARALETADPRTGICAASGAALEGGGKAIVCARCRHASLASALEEGSTVCPLCHTVFA